MSRTTPLDTGQSGDMSVAVHYADHGLSPKQREHPIAQEWTGMTSQWITTLPESEQDIIVQEAEKSTTWPSELRSLSRGHKASQSVAVDLTTVPKEELALAQATAEEDYKYNLAVATSNLVMNLTFYETIKMIDCTKHPNFIAEILNELL